MGIIDGGRMRARLSAEPMLPCTGAQHKEQPLTTSIPGGNLDRFAGVSRVRATIVRGRASLVGSKLREYQAQDGNDCGDFGFAGAGLAERVWGRQRERGRCE